MWVVVNMFVADDAVCVFITLAVLTAVRSGDASAREVAVFVDAGDKCVGHFVSPNPYLL